MVPQKIIAKWYIATSGNNPFSEFKRITWTHVKNQRAIMKCGKQREHERNVNSFEKPWIFQKENKYTCRILSVYPANEIDRTFGNSINIFYKNICVTFWANYLLNWKKLLQKSSKQSFSRLKCNFPERSSQVCVFRRYRDSVRERELIMLV